MGIAWMDRWLDWLDRRCNESRRSRWLHDARAPLAGIVGLVDLLQHGAGPAEHEHLLSIRRLACSLLSTVDQRFSHGMALGEHLLVVCDDERRRREWLSTLADRGFRPFGARDALDALRLLSLESFDAVLIDGRLDCLEPGLLERAIRTRPVVNEAMQVVVIDDLAAITQRDTAPTARAPRRPARARVRG